MRSHIGGHTHGDAGGAINQQVREGSGQNSRLHELVVVVRHEVDHIFVKIRSECLSNRSHTRLSIAGGGRAVVEGTKVAVAVDQGQAQSEGLSQAHHCIVDSGVTVRVELTHHLTGYTCALDVALIGA